jgi:hypothetical protein
MMTRAKLLYLPVAIQNTMIKLKQECSIFLCFTIYVMYKIKLSLCSIKHYAMKTEGEENIHVPAFLTYALDTDGQPASHPHCFIHTGKETLTTE